MILVFVAGLVAACAPRLEWYKKDAAKAEIRDAVSECRAEAQSYGFLDRPGGSRRMMTRSGERYSKLGLEAVRREADVFDNCMYARGFTRIGVPKS